MKIAFVTQIKSPPKWISNVEIIENAILCLKGIKTIQIFDLSEVEKIQDYQKIVLYTPSLKSSDIQELLTSNQDADFYLQLFANLTSRKDIWCEILTSFNDKKLTILSACHAAMDQYRYFLKDDIRYRILKYPLVSWRDKIEKFHGTHFLYGGRICHSKGFTKTVKAFMQTLQLREDIHLHIAGNISHWDYPLRKIRSNRNSLNGLINSIQKNKNITYHGHLPRGRFHDLLSKVHCLISPSVFHDDDFNMNAANALKLKSDLILSHWGGLKYYNENFETKSVSIKLQNNLPKINFKELFQSILNYKYDNERVLRNYLKVKEELLEKRFIKDLTNILNEKASIYKAQTDTLKLFDINKEEYFKAYRSYF